MTDQKRCPYCAEEIRLEAIKCRHCGSMVDGHPQPVTALSEPWNRSRRGAMLAGVCAGLAERFEISVTVIRLAFVVSFLLGFGTSLLLYAVLWVVMPVDESGRSLLDSGEPYDPID